MPMILLSFMSKSARVVLPSLVRKMFLRRVVIGDWGLVDWLIED
jgi:hypothetical protein